MELFTLNINSSKNKIINGIYIFFIIYNLLNKLKKKKKKLEEISLELTSRNLMIYQGKTQIEK